MLSITLGNWETKFEAILYIFLAKVCRANVPESSLVIYIHPHLTQNRPSPHYTAHSQEGRENGARTFLAVSERSK